MTQLFRAPMVVLDFETTGFIRDEWARAIELAAVLLDTTGREVDTWSSLIRPDVLDERASKALAINHIAREELLSAPTLATVAPSFVGWMRTHGDPYVTSFNRAFDEAFAVRSGFRLRWASCVMLKAMGPMGAAGALQPSKWKAGEFKWPSLAEAAAFFDVPPMEPAHRALADARRAAAVACAIRAREIAATAFEERPSA